MPMEAFFNELSCYPLCDNRDEAEKRVDGFVHLLKKAHDNQFNIVRCPDKGISEIYLCEDYSLADLCNKNPRGLKEMLLLSMIRPPYFKENSNEENIFIENTYFVEITDNSGVTSTKEVYGLAAAMLNKSIALNFCSCDFWQLNKCQHIIENYSKKKYKVYSFSISDDFHSEHFTKWKVSTFPRCFADCGILPQNKKCKLSSDHHGNKELESFAKSKLFNLPYISEVITSIRYSSYCNTFVKTVNVQSKRLEVVLHWTDSGYGMEIQTTARTDWELYQIAEELEKLFGPPKY